MRPLSWLALGLLLLGAAGQQPSPPAEVQVASRPYAPHTALLRAQGNLIEVAVVVRDRHRLPEANLTAADFELLDEGKPQPITTFAVVGALPPDRPSPSAVSPVALPSASPAASPATSPTSIALFFDDDSMSPVDLGMARNAAEKYLRAGLAAPLRLAVFTTSGQNQLDFTTDASVIAADLRRLTPRPRMSEYGITPNVSFSPYLAYEVTQNDSPTSPIVRSAMGRLERGEQCFNASMCYDMAVADARQTMDVAEAASTDTLAALQRGIALLARQPGQRTLLLASSGFLTDALPERQEEVAEAALRAGVVVDALDAKLLDTEPVGMSPLESSLRMSERDDLNRVLATLASTTGGEFFHNDNDLGGALRRMTSTPQLHYLLGFSPAVMPEDGKFHLLKVRLAHGDSGDVQARGGYFDPAADTDPFAHAPFAALDGAVLAAGAQDAVPATISTDWLGDASGHSRLQVTVRVDGAGLQLARSGHLSRRQLYFVTAIFDEQGRFVAGKEAAMTLALSDATRARFAAAGVTARLSLPLPAGHYRLREVVEVEGKTTARDLQLAPQ